LIEGASTRPKPLRVLVLADANSIHTEAWLRGLAASGPIELQLVTMNPAGVRAGLREIEAITGITEFYAGPVNPQGGNWRYLLNLPKLVRAVRHMKPEAIVAIYLSSYGLMGAIAKGHAVLAHVLIGSDVMVAPDRTRLHKTLSRMALARGDLFVSSSNTITAKLSALANIPPDAILTQQYGLEDWVLDYPSLPKTFGFVSNRAWLANSRIPMLLRIFSRLRSPDTLALVGGGGPSDTQIRQQANDDPRVTALGVLSYAQNIEVVARSGFYLSMTASDGASLSLMEAMAVGAIPVVSDIEPNREWVEHGVNGALLPLGDEASAVARIESLLAEPDANLEAMRVRNRAVVRERGSRTHNMARFRARLTDVLAQRKELP
jgi:glycosyltransferase involved in cell wall biosynthesis